MRLQIILAAGLLAALTGCNKDSDRAPAGGASGGSAAGGSAVSFVAFGDAGTGSERQIAVGEAMAAICELRGCDFALELGDNFYLSGVNSVDDAQFQSKFEVPYQKLKVPVYVTLGNHDNSRGPGEGSDNAKGEHQVDYHYLAGKVSDKFRMPARYYQFPSTQQRGEGPLAEFWSLDSNPLTSIIADPSPAWNAVTYGAEQQTWFVNSLKASKAHWKIAFAHHPYISNGIHGNAGNYDGAPPLPVITTSGQPWKEFLDNSLCPEHVDIYLQGHDHDLEWLKPVEACGKTQFFVSGAAEGPRPFGNANRNPAYWQVDNTLGFFWFRLEGDRFTAAAYTLDGDLKLPVDTNGKPVAAFEQSLPKPY